MIDTRYTKTNAVHPSLNDVQKAIDLLRAMQLRNYIVTSRPLMPLPIGTKLIDKGNGLHLITKEMTV